jgi:hypothetical protein
MSTLAGKDVGVGDEIAMDGGWKLDGELDRSVVWDRRKFQFRHRDALRFEKARAPGRD